MVLYTNSFIYIYLFLSPHFTATSTHSSVVAMMLFTPHRLGTYLCAFPEFTIMQPNLSLAGETTMQVSQKTFAPLFSMRLISSGCLFFTAREVYTHTSFFTFLPLKSCASLSSSLALLCGHPNAIKSGSPEE